MELSSKGILQGNLGYLAPEQSGRINRHLDYRSDYYSLGATLYYLIAERELYQCETALDYVHSHIAVPAEKAARFSGNIHGFLREIILQLLNKEADERYQSSFGILEDLNVFKSFLEQSTNLPLEVGAKDFPERFEVPAKLFGRTTELEHLNKSLGQVDSTKSMMVSVSGPSGIGKTSLIHEIRGKLAEKKGWFIEGKFDQYSKNLPLSAISTALNDLIDQLLALDENEGIE